MSISLSAAVVAALALMATPVDPITVTAAPSYDPCGQVQMVKVASKVHHLRRRRQRRPAAATVVRPHAPIKPHPRARRRLHRRHAHMAQARQTCSVDAAGFTQLELRGLAPTPALAPASAAPNAVDATAVAAQAIAAPETNAQPDFAPPPDDGDPFMLGPPGLGGEGGGGGGPIGSGPVGGGGGTGPVISPTTPTGPVPEPSSWAFMLAGFALLGAALRRRPACA